MYVLPTCSKNTQISTIHYDSFVDVFLYFMVQSFWAFKIHNDVSVSDYTYTDEIYVLGKHLSINFCLQNYIAWYKIWDAATKKF